MYERNFYLTTGIVEKYICEHFLFNYVLTYKVVLNGLKTYSLSKS